MLSANKIIGLGISNINRSIAQKPCAINFGKNDEFASKNLLHFLKKPRSAEEISRFLSELSDEDKYVGVIPENWRNKFNACDLKDKTRQIQLLFSEFAKESYSPKKTSKSELSEQIKSLSNGLEQILGEKCNVEHIGSGGLGKVFRIRCANEDLALKIYHSDLPKYRLVFHGGAKEIANAIHLNHTLKPQKCAKFYCGKVTLNDEQDAFMLCQYVSDEDETGDLQMAERVTPNKYVSDEDEAEDLQLRPLWQYSRFDYGDSLSTRNMKNGRIVDFGGIIYNFKNKEQQELAKKLYPLIISGDTGEILKMKEKYKSNKDFNELIEQIIERENELLKNRYTFLHMALDGLCTKKEIDALKAIGVDFSPVESYNYSRYPSQQEAISALEKLGLTIKSAG